ncbi:hypothetical protein [Mycolicibacter kumamotonensis]|uniref:Uncharacterized protein n=1 Tax=Mycolicibacter kumamotonensis TaxID=354243 RepID=A0A1B8SL15_9MYCO|nr:hypothetical protein [Mycolicibacter kumamotonensis]OBY33442.1 hypothetical protein ACT18_00360 [Mycolicibacter kumamotonensis]
MNYSDAIAQLRVDQNLPYWEEMYPDEPIRQYIIAKEVGGALAEGFGDRIDFGVFDNCREWGLTFTAGGWTFCCYEHRNSDEIHIEGCPSDQVQPYGPYGGESKYDTLFHAASQQYQVVTKTLVRMIEAALRGEITDRESVVALVNDGHN